ncbi:hypothetical protein IWX49DRAFT_162894 [Phyllosticta citricarpa]
MAPLRSADPKQRPLNPRFKITRIKMPDPKIRPCMLQREVLIFFFFSTTLQHVALPWTLFSTGRRQARALARPPSFVVSISRIELARAKGHDFHASTQIQASRRIHVSCVRRLSLLSGSGPPRQHQRLPRLSTPSIPHRGDAVRKGPHPQLQVPRLVLWLQGQCHQGRLHLGELAGEMWPATPQLVGEMRMGKLSVEEAICSELERARCTARQELA